jgi:hypothetical protein
MPAVRPLGTAAALPAAAAVLLSTAPAVAVAVVESGVESVLESCEEERENRGSRISSNSTPEEMVLLQYVASRNVNVT